MKLITKKQIGKNTYTFEFEGKNLFDVTMESQKLSFPDKIENCANCGSDMLVLNARLAGKKGEFHYVEIKCQKCSATLEFGQRKDDKDTVFLKKVLFDGKKVPEWKVKGEDGEFYSLYEKKHNEKLEKNAEEFDEDAYFALLNKEEAISEYTAPKYISPNNSYTSKTKYRGF